MEIEGKYIIFYLNILNKNENVKKNPKQSCGSKLSPSLSL